MKLAVESKDGRILLGNHVIELEDRSKDTFLTDDLAAFASYLEGETGYRIFYDTEHVEAWPEAVSHDTVVIARCTVGPSWAMQSIMGAQNIWQPLKEFECFLRPLRGALCTQGRALLNNLPDFRVSKVLNVARSNDRRGNYELQIKRGSGSDDVVIPETIAFAVPILKWCDTTEKFCVDVEFDMVESSDGMQMKFRIVSPNLAERYSDAAGKVITEMLSGLDALMYRGTFKLVSQDNGWMHRENRVVW